MNGTLLGVFLNAWWIAVNTYHNKEMQYLNNPTPEVICAMVAWKARLRRLQEWASKRWGEKRVGQMIYERQHAQQPL